MLHSGDFTGEAVSCGLRTDPLPIKLFELALKQLCGLAIRRAEARVGLLGKTSERAHMVTGVPICGDNKRFLELPDTTCS